MKIALRVYGKIIQMKAIFIALAALVALIIVNKLVTETGFRL